MWRTMVARLAIGGAAIFALGGAAGLGLANFTESGAFRFYTQPRTLAEWPGEERAGEPRSLPFEAAPQPRAASFAR